VVVAATTTEGAGSAGYLIRVVGIVLVLILWRFVPGYVRRPC
jgi:hypothetical protein